MGVLTIIDIETSSLSHAVDSRTLELRNTSEILEVGYLRVNDQNINQIYDGGELYFYKPYFLVGDSDQSPAGTFYTRSEIEQAQQAQQYHKLTTEFLKQYQDKFEENLVILNTLFQQGTIVTKNGNNFDIPYIKKFLRKHSKGATLLQDIVDKNTLKDTATGEYYWAYRQDPKSIDIQDIMDPIFKERWVAVNGSYPEDKTHGTLTDYVRITPGCQEFTDKVYGLLDKARITRQHGALYDVCMTYSILRWLAMNGKL